MSARTPGVRATGLCAAALAAIVLGGCKVDVEAFHQKIYGCNPNAADPACGKDQNEQPMACVAAYQLGGRNFCATGCDATKEAPEGPDAICLPSGPKNAGPVSGARLVRCNPAQPGNPCGNDELSCLRTDLLQDEGVCMTVNACQADVDCRDPVRAKCLGELLRENYGDKAGLRADHTYCVQFGCRERRTACSPGETCMRDVIPKSSNPSDICVPNCDANRNCPANYFCYPDLYSRASPAICIPGLLGLRCRSRVDCLFGDCVMTNAGYGVCSVKCANDDDCARFDSEHGAFVCNGEGWCAGARAFRGGQCLSDSDCLHTGEVCARISNTSRFGSCVYPCPENRTCPAYGGIPHACRPQADLNPPNPAIPFNLLATWVCWPGYFGQLCSKDSECMTGLGCRTLVPGTLPLRTCSIECATDADCQANRLTKDGWCDPAPTGPGICRSPIADDGKCIRDVQCESKKCIQAVVQGENTKICDKTPGY